MSVLLPLSVLSWSKHSAHLDLQHELSTWVNRKVSVETLSLGVFQTKIEGLVVPTTNTTTFTNDVEIGSIQIEYTTFVPIDDVNSINRLSIDQMTIHWKGLLGKNIQEIVGSIKGHIPKSRRRKGQATSPNTFEINEVLITNTTVFIHIGNNVDSIVIPRILLRDIQGGHQSVLKKIIGQIRSYMTQDQAK